MGHLARVEFDGAVHLVELPGRWRLDRVGERMLAPGDLVELKSEPSGLRIEKLTDRRNHFTRRAPGPKPLPLVMAANLDWAVVVASAVEPTTPFGLVDRLLVAAALGGVSALLLVNKIDLVSEIVLGKWRRYYRYAVSRILFTSALTGRGIDELAELVNNSLVLLAGSSGVGKTALINRLEPNLKRKTKAISPATGKGRHTTSSAELIPAAGGWVVDTPGLRECAPWGLTEENLVAGFPEISTLAKECKFRNCRHRNEAGCAVIRRVGMPRLPNSRYQSYIKMLGEIMGRQR